MNYTDASSSEKERKRQLFSQLAGHGMAPAQAPITSRASLDQFPLSFAQQRIWFLDQLGLGPQYNDPFHLRLAGSLEPRVLQQALNEIVRRHGGRIGPLPGKGPHPGTHSRGASGGSKSPGRNAAAASTAKPPSAAGPPASRASSAGGSG